MSGHSVLYKLTCNFFPYPSHAGCGIVQRTGRETHTLLKYWVGNSIRISERLKFIYNSSWKIKHQDILFLAIGKSDSTVFILTFDLSSCVRGPSVILLFRPGLFPRLKNRIFLMPIYPTSYEYHHIGCSFHSNRTRYPWFPWPCARAEGQFSAKPKFTGPCLVEWVWALSFTCTWRHSSLTGRCLSP